MGRAKADDVWITIMSNSNIVAVASLADTACILLAEGVELDDNVKTIAEAKGINVLTSGKTAYELAVALSSFLK
jgi:serine kinase of HPr protein (carbohydrate metabolism regulator)